jgi:hypothetical protein
MLRFAGPLTPADHALVAYNLITVRWPEQWSSIKGSGQICLILNGSASLREDREVPLSFSHQHVRRASDGDRMGARQPRKTC